MHKLKLSIPLLLILGLLMTLPSQPVFAAEESRQEALTLVVNDVELTHAKAYAQNDTIYVPFRAVFEHLDIPFDYDAESHSISYMYQDEPYSIDIHQDNIYMPDRGSHLLIPLLMIEQRTYIPQEFVEDLLRIDVEHDALNNRLLVRSLNYAYDEILYSLAEGYFNEPMDGYDYSSAPAITEVLETHIGKIYYKSVTEAIVTTSRLSQTPAVSTVYEVELHFVLKDDSWRISNDRGVRLQIDLLEDVEAKAAALLQTSPDKVQKVLSDVRANYAALNGTDVEAAIKAYSPLYIDEWNHYASRTWEEIVELSATYPSSRKDLLEAKVIHIDDELAVVYVKTLYTELPQTYGGTYEVGELEEPHEYEDVLYLVFTDGERWTFYQEDPLDSNYVSFK